jgi:hypothetical protein
MLVDLSSKSNLEILWRGVVEDRRVALEWCNRVVTVAHGHYRAALRYSKCHFWLGVPTVFLAAIVGTSVFATLQSKPDLAWQIVIGLMSIAAAVLSALQSFLNLNEKAEKHRTAGARYNAIGRELEQLLAQDETWSLLTDIRGRIDKLAEESPHIPEAVHDSLKNLPVASLWHQ